MTRICNSSKRLSLTSTVREQLVVGRPFGCGTASGTGGQTIKKLLQHRQLECGSANYPSGPTKGIRVEAEGSPHSLMLCPGLPFECRDRFRQMFHLRGHHAWWSTHSTHETSDPLAPHPPQVRTIGRL
jgi:hypothetical protein